jgi:RNA polymerase sigma-70 factor (ECF subfamily)
MSTTIEHIWNEHADQLRGFIYRRIPDPSVVDDLVQEVFVKVQSRVETLKDEARLQGWLYQITRNVIVDHFRGRKPEEELPDTLDLPEEEQSRVLEELAECVRPMMNALPEKYRLPVLLSELDGLPQKEVDKRLGLSLSAAKSRVQRGRERLKEIFADCCHFEMDHRGSVTSYERKKGDCRC